jgi:hypothetical protein
MSQYFKIVNPVKRQYIDAIRFSENIKASGYMRGYHAVAVALLVCLSGCRSCTSLWSTCRIVVWRSCDCS